MKLFGYEIKFTKAEEKKDTYPNHFGMVIVNNISKSQGIDDEINKRLVRFVNGNPVEIKPYSKQLEEVWSDIYGIPIIHEQYNDSEEFEFDEVEEWGLTRVRTKI